MNTIVNTIRGRLSLREPQYKSLEILHRVTELVPPGNQVSLPEALAIIRSEFGSVEDFERSFPSLCFAIATGVGKTRLMGAFISYLHIAHGIKNFFVLAPGLTIYNKLITDFTPGTPKYVFKGIAEFAVNAPTILTGDNYNDQAETLFDTLSQCRINIFNISKINAEVRGGKKPKIKQLSEYIGQSYFDYLASLPDLVMLMDESHRYRASAGIRAINELRPILGLELTATPFIETPKGAVPFKNIVYDYPLARAMEDGFVKEPAVVTKENFSTHNMTPAAIEDIKLVDGIRLHEIVKVELETYARDTGNKLVKPFVLIIARDTTHATQLLKKIQSNEISDGYYKDKVIQVDSSTKEEEVIERLLRVEDTTEPTEIVIHVNMLKEGWDVNNLYTIIPLRAASARILIEQSIGRGLRLPYGKRTGVAAVDTLNIVAHDKFQEIIDEARKPDSQIKLKSVIISDADLARKTKTVVSYPTIDRIFELSDETKTTSEPQEKYFKRNEIAIAQAAYDVIKKYSKRPEAVPTSAHLDNNNIKQAIIKEVEAALLPAQPELGFKDEEIPDVATIVEKAIQAVRRSTIDIPQINIIPRGAVEIGFKSFTLNTKGLKFQPVSDKLVLQDLRTGEQQRVSLNGIDALTGRPEDLIVDLLVDKNDISYERHADMLYELAAEAIRYLASYLSREQVDKVVQVNVKVIAETIYQQMQANMIESANEGYEVKVSKGFIPLKHSAYTQDASELALFFKNVPPNKNNIRAYIFNGFTNCLYPMLKFDSDAERRLAVILDKDSEKWFRPVSGQFPIYYLNDNNYSLYEPDFAAETTDAIYMVEVKDRSLINDDEVTAKATAATTWCKHASDFSVSHGGKPWKYIVIPDNEIIENMTLIGLYNHFSRLFPDAHSLS